MNNSLNKSNNLEEEVKELKNLVKGLFDIVKNKPEQPVGEIQHKFDVTDELEEGDSFNSTLEKMNQYGNQHGFCFKRGQIYQNGIKTIVCKYYDRNKKKVDDKKIDCLPLKDSDKPRIKDIDCPVSYKFSVNLNRSCIYLRSN